LIEYAVWSLTRCNLLSRPSARPATTSFLNTIGARPISSLNTTIHPRFRPDVVRKFEFQAAAKALQIAQIHTEAGKPGQESPKDCNVKKDGAKKLGKVAQLTQKYGKAFITVYLSVYVVTLALLFAGITISGYSAQKIIDYAKSYEFLQGRVLTFLEDKSHEYPSLANFVAAWCSAKLTEPIRIVVTVAILGYLAKTGKIRVNKAMAMIPVLTAVPPMDDAEKK
jgi:hypothetical protein